MAFLFKFIAHITFGHITSGKYVRDVYPFYSPFYLGYAVVYLFYLFLLQNIDCGYSLEPPRLAVLTCTHMF